MILAAAYLGLLIFIVFLELTRSKQNNFDFLTFFHLLFGLMYPFSAMMLSINPLVDSESASSSPINLHSIIDETSLKTAIAIFLGYFLVLIGFHAKSAQEAGERIKVEAKNDNTIIIAAVFFLLLSALAIQIYSLQYGGIAEAIAKTHLIRSTAVDSGGLVFFKHFMLLSYVSSYLIAAYLFIKKTTNIKLQTFLYGLFIITIVVSWIAATLKSGRANVIKYLLTFFLVYIKYKGKVSWTVLVPSLYGILFFINYGKTIFFSLSALPDGLDAVIETMQQSIESKQDNAEGGFSDTLANFAYPIQSLNACFSNHYDLRLFKDFFYAIIDFIPEKLLNPKVIFGINLIEESISSKNTYLIAGTNDFEIPTGFLAFGIYSLSWPGMILVCLVYGWLGRYFQAIAEKHFYKIFWMPMGYILLNQFWVDYLTAGDPNVFLISDLWLWFSWIPLLILCTKISLEKRSPQERQKKIV
jgi:hypothetical protein